MECPRCSEAMHEIEAGLWTCPCGASLRLDVQQEYKAVRDNRHMPAPSFCTLDCPERKRCDVKNNPKRCAVFRAVKVRGMRTLR